jgi:beta-N-acetylhexosaminidase
MLGQMIIARFHGPRPSASFLARIHAGEIGGVILFADNVAGGLGATKALTAELQGAAREGGRPPLLIMTDQEGGEVRRLPGPPTLAPAAMDSSAIAFAQGAATGRLLRSVGINVDLAPVADVERVAGSFLGSRSFGSTPTTVAERACAFARGLVSRHVAYTLKHFPGLGRAGGSTDFGPVTIDALAGVLRADYRVYQACGANPLALVMVSNASYPALSGPVPAVMSPAIYHRELPLATNSGSDLTISDDLQAGAIANQLAPARRAIGAGLDMAMYAQTEEASASAYAMLLADARSGALTTGRIRDADRAIASLKRLVAP